MKKRLLLIMLMLQGISFAQATQKSVLDTMVFDLANATTYSGPGVTYFEFPVYAVTTGGISNFDFWFQFDETKLTYDTTTAVDINLDTYSNFNMTSNVLSNTTSGPSLAYNIQGNTPLIKLRFLLATPTTTIDTVDFFACTALFNGLPCNFYWTSSGSNSGAGTVELKKTVCNFGIQNPSTEDFLLQNVSVEKAALISNSGQVIWEKKNNDGVFSIPFGKLSTGEYFLHLDTQNGHCSQKIVHIK